MGHHTGQFRFLIGVQNQAGVDVEEAARQRHGVDLVRINDLDGEGNLGVGVLYEVLADAVHVFNHHRIGNELCALFDLRGVHLAHLDLGIGGVPVAHAARADVAIAHRAHIVHAARLDTYLLTAGLDHLIGIDGGSGDIASNRGGAGRGLFCRSGGGGVAAHRGRAGSRLGRRSAGRGSA